MIGFLKVTLKYFSTENESKYYGSLYGELNENNSYFVLVAIKICFANICFMKNKILYALFVLSDRYCYAKCR